MSHNAGVASRTDSELASRVLGEVAAEKTKVAVANKLILAGHGNVEVLFALIRKFDLREHHFRYPEIFRAKLVENGALTTQQARATRGPSIPRQPDEVANLFEKLRAPDVDLDALIASLPGSRTATRRTLRTAFVHRAWVDDTACGEPSERVAEDLGDVTCPRCLASFEGWWGPDGTCPECDRSEVDGHGEECGLVTGESDLANSAPFARGAPGVGATRRPFLLGRRQALQQKRVRDEAAQLQHMEAQVAAHRARLEAMRTEVQP